MKLSDVKNGLTAAGFRAQVVDELLEAYEDAKRNFHLRQLRPSAIDGGRFSEAAFRILQEACGLTPTALGTTLPTVDKLLDTLRSVAATNAPESVRIHIPRTLRLVYDIRNKRDAAHLADGIDPNFQDASLVIANLDWVMAELVRLYHSVSANDAQAIIDELVEKEVPAVQEIDGHPVILKDLQARDRALLLLYRAGSHAGLSLDELAHQLREGRKDNLRIRLRRLDELRVVFEHPSTGRFHITSAGIKHVQDEGLAQPV